jgi:DNA-binding CsgD family transcriptional regulator
LSRIVWVGGRIIGNAPAPTNHGHLDLADRLAVMASDQARAAHAWAGQLSRDLSALLEVLARLREDRPGAGYLLDRSARELCGAGIFGRVMVSRVNGSTWLPGNLYTTTPGGRVVVDIDEGGAQLGDLEIPLASPLIEAEVVRRRLPALVSDAGHEPRAHRELVERTGTTEYVVAPIVAGEMVVGLLHADNRHTTRGGGGLTAIQRDLLRLYADGVGLNCERLDLLERRELQRRSVIEVCSTAARALQDYESAPRPGLRLVVESEGQPGAPASPTILVHTAAVSRNGGRLSRLTAREREVLALLASGATNAQLADRLTVAESTVKSHVKHILHKLGAGNRAAAIACYLRESRVDERRLR